MFVECGDMQNANPVLKQESARITRKSDMVESLHPLHADIPSIVVLLAPNYQHHRGSGYIPLFLLIHMPNTNQLLNPPNQRKLSLTKNSNIYSCKSTLGKQSIPSNQTVFPPALPSTCCCWAIEPETPPSERLSGERREGIVSLSRLPARSRA